MIYYAALDTNVLVSAMLKSDSIPGKIVELALNGNITPIFSTAILEEYREVLNRPKFHLGTEITDTLLQAIIERGINITVPKSDILHGFPDPDDIIFYEIVMEKRKDRDAYLVTGNLRHFPVKPFIVTPKEMLDLIHKCPSDR